MNVSGKIEELIMEMDGVTGFDWLASPTAEIPCGTLNVDCHTKSIKRLNVPFELEYGTVADKLRALDGKKLFVTLVGSIYAVFNNFDEFIGNIPNIRGVPYLLDYSDDNPVPYLICDPPSRYEVAVYHDGEGHVDIIPMARANRPRSGYRMLFIQQKLDYAGDSSHYRWRNILVTAFHFIKEDKYHD